MRSIQNLGAAVRATQPRISARLQEHRAITRLSLASLALAVAMGVSLQDATAGAPPANIHPASLLPENVGVGVLTTDAVAITFEHPMDPSSVRENLTLFPQSATSGTWSADLRTLTLHAVPRWRTDARYVVSVAASALRQDGSPLGAAHNVSFTTQTAPTVAEFQVRLTEPAAANGAIGGATAQPGAIPYNAADFMRLGDEPLIDAPEDSLAQASAETGIQITFATAMDQTDVESRFRIEPAVKGTFHWDANRLVFSPRDRLAPDTRYAVSLVGAHDRQGNRVAGDVSFSFTTREGAELVRFTPSRHARNVTAKQIVIQFSEPMSRRITRDALSVIDFASGRRIQGATSWSKDDKRLAFAFHNPLPRGRLIEVRLSKAARDIDGNRISIRWTFETKASPAAAAEGPVAQAPAPVTGPAAPADLQQFALWQINQSRAQYGFAPMRLDAQVAAVASAHAWDQINFGYFSHTGRDGSRVSDRLRRAGVSFSSSGENMCYYNGIGVRAMLEWCHSTFMSEPYPGFANHIGNILSANYTRVGIGIAQSGGKVIIVWDFAG